MADDDVPSDLKTNITAGHNWLRGLYILLFAVIYGVAEVVLVAVVVFQFVCTLITGRTNARLVDFGQALATFVYEILLYLTYRSDTKPFPFSDFPSGPPNAPRGRRTRKTPKTRSKPDTSSA